MPPAMALRHATAYQSAPLRETRASASGPFIPTKVSVVLLELAFTRDEIRIPFERQNVRRDQIPEITDRH